MKMQSTMSDAELADWTQRAADGRLRAELRTIESDKHPCRKCGERLGGWNWGRTYHPECSPPAVNPCDCGHSQGNHSKSHGGGRCQGRQCDCERYHRYVSLDDHAIGRAAR